MRGRNAVSAQAVSALSYHPTIPGPLKKGLLPGCFMDIKPKNEARQAWYRKGYPRGFLMRRLPAEKDKRRAG